MPELPEVETTKTSLAPLLEQRLTAVEVFQPKLRWLMPADLDALIDYTLQNVERRAKYLILTFIPNAELVENSQTMTESNSLRQRKLIIHLGMSGSLQQHLVGTDKRKHDHLVITFDNANGIQSQLHYHDPRRFGAVLWYKDYSAKLLDHLGPEPLSADFTADYLYQLIQRSNGDETTDKKTKKRPITRAIKSVIMEQQVVVGVGNIYATESLYLAAIHPATPAHNVSYNQIVILVDHIKIILQRAIELGGSTLRDFTVASGQTGYFQQTLNVYGKQGESCPHCDTALDNIKINGRASVFCPSCQRV
ncbi:MULTISPECIES: bifunctional DNA-formamidopyrimidine glycosylase/DNA-(apurinic or apyrimidinic site) lyase [unclassified Psychrobacter]|uniref:bifunctional DNA-formamidopyrimidine glycosylase/DNA-(apurinic or apyrimidinic site) lyase n=1 Tax=unclassified Psychrobacter TaxID=196806 RepID=UPI00078C2F9B|nr:MULTISPECIES: bifunctional DNA-formamidopyrimidine glycosylase/DNA-(apurinic or apyrimidinic site) lyase [unclassified Psychrobacter]AMN48852.1 5-hydroxymethyluracil DNA glycosylase [Psychrobacter sp. P2G3]AMN66672.1 5-hydroxymethyluracil DNA glycosylase [Psychrobacter sp. P11G5]